MYYLIDKYIEWIKKDIINDSLHSTSDYSNTILLLSSIPFTYSYLMDKNREIDGKNLRYIFGIKNNIPENTIKNNLDILECSVLEMLVSLSIRTYNEIFKECIEEITPSYIFWMMIKNMGLESQTNHNFNSNYILSRIDIMLNHKYNKNGEGGGLFVIQDKSRNMKNVDIWYQMQWWAKELVKKIRERGL